MSELNATNLEKGRAVYSKKLLPSYDWIVTYFSNSFIWRCHRRHIQALFDQCIDQKHLDVGVGTGYYLQNTKAPLLADLTLMDANPLCLQGAAQALEPLSPKTIHADIYAPPEQLRDTFDSVSINYLLHCIPGNHNDKRQAIKNVASLLKKEGTLFGSTIIADPSLQSFWSEKLMGFYNRKGIFSNLDDTEKAMITMLTSALSAVQTKRIGTVLLFEGKKR